MCVGVSGSVFTWMLFPAPSGKRGGKRDGPSVVVGFRLTLGP